MSLRIQEEMPESPDKTYCGGAGRPAMPGEPTGVGGSSVLTNQNEREVNEQSWEMTPIEETGYCEDFSHTQGVYRR